MVDRLKYKRKTIGDASSNKNLCVCLLEQVVKRNLYGYLLSGVVKLNNKRKRNVLNSFHEPNTHSKLLKSIQSLCLDCASQSAF